MSEQIQNAIKEQLNNVIDPYTGKKILAGKSFKSVNVDDRKVVVTLKKGYPITAVRDALSALVQTALQDLPLEGRDVEVLIEQDILAHTAQTGVKPVDGVRNIIAVASGKGGVGKSTVSVNLALALAKAGANVAILDADIYGPSQPRMLGVSGKPKALENKMLVPLENYGVKVMSIGFLIEDDTPMIWRGPMATQALEQMLRGTQWVAEGEDDIDYMVIDLPPGTGDIQLTLSQRVPVTGSVIVTTPQDIALLDARKAYNMFEKVEVPIVGIIENMSTHICTNCGHEEAIFGSAGADKMAADYKLDVLGRIPLELAICQNADSGKPTVIAEPDSATAKIYMNIALTTAAKLSIKKQDFSAKFPNIVVESN